VSVVTVQLFASYAELLGATEIAIPLADRATVGDLVAAIRALPGADALPAEPKVAVNRTFASAMQIVSSSDEVALIPPVAGG
jgi:molybdopterin converting factor subunit 1